MGTITLERFKISVHGDGYYAVSIPEYYGGEVVTADAYDALKVRCGELEAALRGLSLRKSTADGTLCWCTSWDWWKHTSECFTARALFEQQTDLQGE